MVRVYAVQLFLVPQLRITYGESIRGPAVPAVVGQTLHVALQRSKKTHLAALQIVVVV
jgi:hypothetical protein